MWVFCQTLVLLKKFVFLKKIHTKSKKKKITFYFGPDKGSTLKDFPGVSIPLIVVPFKCDSFQTVGWKSYHLVCLPVFGFPASLLASFSLSPSFQSGKIIFLFSILVPLFWHISTTYNGDI